MKSVWVTGAAGFIGFRLAEKLVAEGYFVTLIDHADHFRSRAEHARLTASAHVEIVDRADLFSRAPQLMAQRKPVTIFHMGACSSTMNFDEDYLRKMNVEYSQKLWQLATTQGIDFVYASSAATYGDGSLGYSDSDDLTPKLKPLNPYGESKKIFDTWALEQVRAGKHPPHWSGFRFFNVYGFGERHKEKQSSVVLHAFDQIQARSWIQLFKSHRTGIADGEQKRDFVAVEDVVEVLLFAARKPIASGIFNLGTGYAQSFLDLARAVFQALKKKEDIRFIETPVEIREKYQYFTQADLSRLRLEGYSRPFRTLDEAVPLYIERLSRQA